MGRLNKALRRVVRAIAWLIGGFIAVSLLLVLLLRRVPLPTSAFMLGATVTAWAGGDFDYSNQYDWVPGDIRKSAHRLPHTAPGGVFLAVKYDSNFKVGVILETESLQAIIEQRVRSSQRKQHCHMRMLPCGTGRG